MLAVSAAHAGARDYALENINANNRNREKWKIYL